MLVQGFLLGTQRQKFISLIGLFTILAALFLAFSRGAWISFLVSATMVVGLNFLLAPAAANAPPHSADNGFRSHRPRGFARDPAFR